MQRNAFSPIAFVISILVVSAGLVVFANLLASGFRFHLGLVLLVLGILSMCIGNILGLPARRYERHSGIRHMNLFKIPAPEEYIAGNLFVSRNPASFYSLENVLFLAGLIILLISLFILF
ncbi:MAG: hypothetical protein ACM3PS_01960 [Syntrophothermus sp.]